MTTRAEATRIDSLREAGGLSRDFRTLDGRTFVRQPSGMIYEVTMGGWRKVGVLTDAEIAERNGKESAA